MLRAKKRPEIIVKSSLAGHLRDRIAGDRYGLVEPAVLLEECSKIHVRGDARGIAANGLAILRDRFIDLANIAQRQRKVAVRGRVARVEPQRHAALLDRRRCVSAQPQHFREIGMKVRARRDRNRLPKHVDRWHPPAIRVQKMREQMHGAHVMRIVLQNLSIERLRLLQMSHPMVLQRDLQDVFARRL
jgi:hypothetical protein